MRIFTYMFGDADFNKKFFPASILFFLFYLFTLLQAEFPKHSVAVIFLSLFGLIFNITYTGFAMSCIKSRLEQQESDETILPYVKLWDNFVTGFKYTLGCIVFGLVLAVLFIISGIISKFILITGAFIIGLIWGFYGIALCCIFIKTGKISFLFKIKDAMDLVSQNVGKYIMSLLLIIVFCVIGGALTSLLYFLCIKWLLLGVFGVILLSAIMGFLGTYMTFASAHLIANSVDANCIDTEY